MRRLSALSVALATTALTYTNSAAAAAPEAPLAPVNTSLLQGNPGAPNSIDDVLLVPSASAGQKGAAFEWADENHVQAYVLWNNFFAAAQYTPGGYADTTDSLARTDLSAQAIASFGYMTPSFGIGLALAYRDTTHENTDASGTTAYRQFSQAKLFGSVSTGAMDIYGSLLWAKPYDNDYSLKSEKYTSRSDSLMLQAGARHAPAAGSEGLAWNGNVTAGFDYRRGVNGTIWYAQLYGQVGYVFFTDGINFLPGVDVDLATANAKGTPDYKYVVAAAPYLAITVPLFEHWTLAGGAKYRVEQTLDDETKGDPSTFDDHGLITNTTGNVGLRYARDRWAAEAGISNGFLNRGPNFVSGASGDLLYSFGFTVNLK